MCSGPKIPIFGLLKHFWTRILLNSWRGLFLGTSCISTIHFHSFHSVPYLSCINFQYHYGIFDTSHIFALWYAGGGKKSWRMKTNTWFHPASFPQVWCFLSDCYPIPGKYNNLHLVDDKMRKLSKIWYSWIIFPRIISNRVCVINIKLGLITLDPKINN